jgi:hypothetical protein
LPLEYLENPEKMHGRTLHNAKVSWTGIIQFPNIQYPFELHTKMSIALPHAETISIKDIKNNRLSLHKHEHHDQKYFIDTSEVWL